MNSIERIISTKTNGLGPETLKRSYDHLQKIVHAMGVASPDYTYLFDNKHRFIYASPSLLSLWGKSLEEVVGKNFAELGYPTDLVELHRAQLNEALNGKMVSGANKSFFNGLEGYYEYTFVPVFNEVGDVETIVGTTQDTTYRRKAEKERETLLEQLRESELLFRSFADSMPHLAWMAQSDGRTTWYNKRWYNYTGLKSNEYNEWSWRQVLHPEMKSRILEKWQTAVQNAEPFQMEMLLRGGDGEYRWFLTRGTPVFNSRGELIRWFGTNTNIDAQKRASDFGSRLQKFTSALAETTSHIEAGDLIVKSSHDFFGATRNILAEIDSLNNRLVIKAVFGFTQEQLRQAESFLSLSLKYPMQECARTALPIFCESEADISVRFPDAPPVNQMTSNRAFSFLPLVYNGRVRAVLGSGYSESRVFREDERAFLISAAAQSSQALEKAKMYDALQNAICSRDSFMGIASHELKTPLTSLKLQAQMVGKILQDKSIDLHPERLGKFVGQVNEQVGRLTKLVDDMLDVSRIETGKLAINKELKCFTEVVRSVVDRFAHQFEMVGIPVETLFCKKLIGHFDVFRMEQVLNNILTNALKYAPEKPLKISVERKGAFAQVTVADQGPGIALEDQVRIFERFERLISAAEVSGLGIGLFIAKQIVEAHGGKIWVESELGHGTTFVVQIPTLGI